MNLNRWISIAAAAAVLIASTTLLQAQDNKPVDRKPAEQGKPAEAAKAPDADQAVVMAQKFTYPLMTCPISGEKLSPKASEFVVQGRLVRTCCDDCKAEVQKTPGKAFKAIDDAVVAAQKPTYPLDTCAQTGTKLDDKAVDYVSGTRLVRFANREAIAAFQKDPKAAMAKLDAAYIQAQTASYPLDTCVISGEKLTAKGEPVNKLYGNTLVRLCCNGCVRGFEKDADANLAKIAAARKPAAK